ncbi:MAG: NAD(+)/NADH kinase [Ruminococcaceae bacterium]|nr:NAD(+)/NADH kinase [Oscillospiraceae bacterium]
MKRIAIVTNYNIQEKLIGACSVADRIKDRVDEIMIPQNYKDRILRSHNHITKFSYLPYETIYTQAELIIVLGGDGFMLEAARRAAPEGISILGINMGRVGYMTELEIDEIELIDRVFDGNYRIDERAMLKVEIISAKGQKRANAYALNDAVIANGAAARIVDLELSDRGELVNTYRADGLVIATPTGSTAYSLSAGGPIIDPKLSCFCVTPICPHSMCARPLVFPDTASLEVKNICVREKLLHLTVDGRATFDLFLGDTVVVTKSEVAVKLLRVKGEDFYSKIRERKFV